ncbi:cell surface protein [Methanosarcina siciliae T4/M]|uniref:Cell surface protein n=1 Tax=Methanosarcina siciliae T4/M TaxID=1434120 RepID=A0A0E3L7P3_9EURY|nr:DUF5050 domain-containing protein [Methanosarcina siciliae]AKB27121.1 cell surface protein [Methanosarcina siciliae T4/M]
MVNREDRYLDRYLILLASTVLLLVLFISTLPVALGFSLHSNRLTIKETQLTTNSSDEAYPSIYGDRVVWQDLRNGKNWDIYMYDLSTSRETQITTDPAAQYFPAIYGDRIIWTDARNGKADIYMYDLSTSTESQITTSGSVESGSALYGDRIVWIDYREGWENLDIYLYDFSSSTETQITTNESNQWGELDIWGNMIVWRDQRNGNNDIYMCTVSGEDAGSEVEPEIRSEVEPELGSEVEPEPEGEGSISKNTSGFEIVYSVVGLLAVFLQWRR